jgi:hypothetical protein
MEMERKKVQFATLFHILEGVHPIVEYENRKALYSFINVPKKPKMHKSNNLNWIMVEFMYAQVTKAILATISIANYMVLTCDEVNTMDNGG